MASDISKSRKSEGSRVPDDVIFNILLALSVKTLCRFRSVCKSWNEIVSDPHFRQLHLKRSRKNPLLLVNSVRNAYWSLDKKGTEVKKFTSPERLADLYMMNTGLELICFYDAKKVYVCNPTTRELLDLPNKSSQTASGHMRKPQIIGLGYVHSTKEYKAIRVCQSSCDVCTVGIDTKRWRIAKSPPCPVSNCFRYAEGVFINGGIHMFESSSWKGILRFDLEQETWSQLPAAPVKISSNLCQLAGELCVAERDLDIFNLWLMKDYENRIWVKTYAVNIMAPRRIVPLRVEEDGRVLIKCELLRGCKLVYFDVDGNRCGEIEIPAIGTTSRAAVYIESFLKLT